MTSQRRQTIESIRLLQRPTWEKWFVWANLENWSWDSVLEDDRCSGAAEFQFVRLEIVGLHHRRKNRRGLLEGAWTKRRVMEVRNGGWTFHQTLKYENFAGGAMNKTEDYGVETRVPTCQLPCKSWKTGVFLILENRHFNPLVQDP